MIESDGKVSDDYAWRYTNSSLTVTVPAGTLMLTATFGLTGVFLCAAYHNSQAITGYIIRDRTFYIRKFGFFKVVVSAQALPQDDDDDYEPLFDTENMDLTYGNYYPDVPQILMDTRAVELTSSFSSSYVTAVDLPYSQFSWFSMDDTHQYYRTDGHIVPSRRWFDFMFKQGPWIFKPYN